MSTEKRLVADKDSISSFRVLTTEDVIEIKTIIRDIPKKFARIAYKLYEMQEGIEPNSKVTVKNAKGRDVRITIEQEFYRNAVKLKQYKDKIARGLNIKVNPKGTFDTYDIIKIVRQEAKTQTKKRKNASLAVSGFVQRVNKHTIPVLLEQKNLNIIDSISIGIHETKDVITPSPPLPPPPPEPIMEEKIIPLLTDDSNEL